MTAIETDGFREALLEAKKRVEAAIQNLQEENSEHVLEEIKAALKRIEEGTYGMCTNCGKQIAEARLEALPWATLCIDCARDRERG